MDPIIICFECRQRTTEAEIKDGQHSHADLLEDKRRELNPAASGDE
jgi:hypothetical protein